MRKKEIKEAEELLKEVEKIGVKGRRKPKKSAKMKEFKEQVLLESQRLDNYREERLEEDLKNLVKPSTTKQGGTGKNKSSSKT